MLLQVCIIIFTVDYVLRICTAHAMTARELGVPWHDISVELLWNLQVCRGKTVSTATTTTAVLPKERPPQPPPALLLPCCCCCSLLLPLLLLLLLSSCFYCYDYACLSTPAGSPDNESIFICHRMYLKVTVSTAEYVDHRSPMLGSKDQFALL